MKEHKMGRFKKSKATRTVLLAEDVKYLAENTQFNKDNIGIDESPTGF
jgi:hypothetical protein